ncbi:MAG: hypothetical protein ACI89L_001447 [Phycisphaerales bacterium]|jgi:hypothetical protein
MIVMTREPKAQHAPRAPHPPRPGASRARAAAVLLLAGLALPATAQLFEDLDKVPERPDAAPVAPALPDEASQPVPGITGGVDWFERVRGENLGVEVASRLAEGTFVVRRPGTLLSISSGHRVWVPDAATRLPGEGAMLLIPCQTLARMDSAFSTASADTARVLISGEVFLYHGRNYLLPTAFARAATPEPPQPGPTDETTGETTGETTAEPPSISDNPEIDELMKSLDDSMSTRGLEMPAADTSQSRTATSTMSAMPEGAYIARRRGRLMRGDTGAWTVTFDNDTDTSARTATAPLIVVPCRLLMQLETRAKRRGDQLALTVSGRVYAYGESQFLVPTLMQEVSDHEIAVQQ